ncbi:hypothetical protein BC332_18761 [Capsicum chinense]|nr:hypothetical protein BC332_18761 [Capsicum chinense]
MMRPSPGPPPQSMMHPPPGTSSGPPSMMPPGTSVGGASGSGPPLPPVSFVTVASRAALGKYLQYELGGPRISVQTAYGVEVEVEKDHQTLSNFEIFACYALEYLNATSLCLKGFDMFMELEDDSEELVHAIVGKMGVEHMVVHYTPDMEVGEQSIMNFRSDYVELGHKLGLEPKDNDDVVFLTVPAVQLQ